MASRELPVSVALAGLSASVALAFAGIFSSDAYLPVLLGAALLPHLLGWLTRQVTRSIAVSALVAAVGLVAYGAVVVGPPFRLLHQATAGWHVLLDDRVPLPATAGALLLTAAAVWVVAAVADDLAFHREATVGALAPAVMVLLWVQIYARQRWLASTLLFVVAAGAFLALQYHAVSGRRRTVVGRSRAVDRGRLVSVAVVGALVAALSGAAVAVALPGLDHPLVRPPGGGGPTGNYTATVAPLVRVGDQLQRGHNTPVFTVQATQPSYWRQVALDEFSPGNGGQWTLEAHGAGAVAGGLHGRVPPGAVRQRFTIGPLQDGWIPAAFDPVAVSYPNTLVVRASNTLVDGRGSIAGLTYTVASTLPTTATTAAQAAATAAPVPASLRRYTALPAGIPPLVRQTALRVTAGRSTPYAKAAALQAYFRDGLFTYDPTVDLSGDGDAIAAFLTTRRGFCVQFASAYAVMAREVGIPSRVAVGFTPGTRDQAGVYHVTTDDAHAWPEIWLAGVGWTNQFEPTPATNQPGGSHLPGEPAPVPTPQPQPVPSTAAPGPAAPAPSRGSGAASPPPPSVSRGGRSASGGGAWQWVVLLVAAVAVGAAALLLRSLVRRSSRRARRRGAADPTEAVAGAWAEALDGLAAAGVTWPRSLTPLEVADEVPARVGEAVRPPLGSLARRYTVVRFGSARPDRDGVAAAWRDADAVQDALDGTLGRVRRVRAHLRYRSAADQGEPAGWSRRRSSSTKV